MFLVVSPLGVQFGFEHPIEKKATGIPELTLSGTG